MFTARNRRGVALFATSAFVAFTLSLPPKAEAAPILVGLELSLLIDVSGSVDGTEYALQRGGYSAAFRDAAVQAAILSNPTGGIAVNFIQWSGTAQQVESIGYTLVNSVASANALADAIDGVARAFSGSTAPGSALAFAAPLFALNDFDGLRQVIDVSGDGAENVGLDTSDARDAALAAGVDTINGLAIGGAAITSFYAANVIGGPGSFAIGVDDFAEFAGAIRSKLVREVDPTPVPEPATLGLFGAGLLAFGMARRRGKAPRA